MVSIQKRKSHGQTYWYIVESRRVNGKPRPVMLEYLGKAEDLLLRLRAKKPYELVSYSHGDTATLINVATELDIVGIINKHIPPGKNGRKPKRDGFTVGASFLLAALGRACRPTSKMGWYEWCKTTSLEYCLKSSFKKLTSQHFWDQMEAFPVENIEAIEEEIVKKLIEKYGIKLDTLLFDTTNFFTFIDSENSRCTIAKRGKQKQKRCDLRQVGLALLVTKENQFPLFHKTYQGNKHDSKLFKEEFSNLIKRLTAVTKELSDVTFVFDKGNNSKKNFKLIDGEKDLHYVGSLVPSYFKDLVTKANKSFEEIEIEDEKILAYKTEEKIWGEERTSVVLISEQLKDGQIRGIHQVLEKKYKELQKFKDQLKNPKNQEILDNKQLEERLKKIIAGQFVKDILKYNLLTVSGVLSFDYYIDDKAFDNLKDSILGRRILVTNRSDWSTEEIILAYRAQSKIEYAFRCIKNPFHLPVRPQYHWTDQKIEAHFFICIIAYLLTVAAYAKAKSQGKYTRNIQNFMEDLKSIRLAAIIQKKKKRGRLKLDYLIEKIPKHLQKIAETSKVSNQNLRPKINFRVYN